MSISQGSDDDAKIPKGNVASLVDRLSKTGLDPSHVPLRKGAGDIKSRRQAQAVYSYTPEHEDELRLEVNDVIEIIGEAEEGWFTGKLNGKTGVFPSNFVRVPSSTPGGSDDDGGGNHTEAPAKAERSSIDKMLRADKDKENEGVHSHGKKMLPGAVGLGNIFQPGHKIELRTAAGSDSKRTVVDSSKSFTDSNANPAEYARTTFDYDAGNEDELSLKVGDIVRVVSKDCEDPGWWVGELRGKTGVFPDNFVELLKPEESRMHASSAKQPGSPPGHRTTTGPAPPTKPPKPGAVSITGSRSGDAPKTNGSSHAQAQVKSPKSTMPAKGSTTSSDDQKSKRDTTPTSKAGLFGTGLFGAKRPSPPSSFGSSNSSDLLQQADNDAGHALLQHPAKARPKHQNKRPPSQVFLQNARNASSTSPSPTDEQQSTTTENSIESRPHPSSIAGARPLLPPTTNTTSSLLSRSPSGGSPLVASENREQLAKLKAEFEAFRVETQRKLLEFESKFASLESKTGAKSSTSPTKL